MIKFIFRRLLEAIPTLFVLITVSFFMMRLAPGSPFSSEKNYSPEVIQNIKAKYNFDKPLLTQYGYYLRDLAHGDFGPSFKYKDTTVNELVSKAFPVSFKLGIYAFIISLIIGVTAGIVAALRQNKWLDYIIMSCAMTGVVVPGFVVAPLLVLLFSLTLHLLPSGGWNDGAFMNLIMPIFALALSQVAGLARIMRSSMIEVLHSNFIRTAKAKGLSMRRIVIMHALRPAMLPVISYLGPAFVGVITGSMVIESIFSIPGIGQIFVQGAINRDYSLVLSLTILVGTLTIVFNAIVDILYAAIDPKIRY